MRDLYSDDYASVAGAGADRLIPDGARRLAGAAVFVALIGAMGLWAYRLGTRDAAEVPIIRAMEGPARVAAGGSGRPPGGAPGSRGERGARRPPAPLPRDGRGGRARAEALAAEDGPQGELVLAAPRCWPSGRRARPATCRCRRRRRRRTWRCSPAAEAARPRRRGRGRAAEAAEPAARSRPAPLPSTGRATCVRRPAKPAPARPPAAAPPRRRGGRPAPRRPPPAAREVAAPGAARLVQLGAFDSEEITRKAWRSWSRGTATCSASKSLYVERTTANARVFYRLRVAGFENTDQTRRDVRGAAGPRHRLHPGDAAVDGAARRHLRLRRAGPDRGGAALLRGGRALGLHPLRAQRRGPGAAAPADRRPARQRRARRAGADRPGGRPGRADARPGLAGVAAGARRMRAAARTRGCGRGRCACATG